MSRGVVLWWVGWITASLEHGLNGANASDWRCDSSTDKASMTWNDWVNGTLEDSRTRSCATHKWEQGWGWFWSWSLICILIEAYKFHILFLSGNPIKILPPAGSWRAQKPLLLTKPPSPTLPYCQHLREYTHPILRWHFLQEDIELVTKASRDMWGKLWDGKHEYEARQFVCPTEVIYLHRK